MRIHILGICGTFMAGLAQILKESGHDVSGSDIQFYPPMSYYLDSLNIKTSKGYKKDSLPKADLYVIGNAISRGNDCVEYILENNLPHTSGPEILGRELKNRKVYAISGTHGKTTTSYMLAHIFSKIGKDIGYLIGGMSKNFDDPAKLGTDQIFVIEADEYDSAFFDKRSKFIHYNPTNLIINCIEFDHVDIFDDIKDIRKQFNHLIKTIKKSGNVIYFKDDHNSAKVIENGIWCNNIIINSDEIATNFSKRELIYDEITYSLDSLPLIGEHNFKNYVCAIVAARLENISIEESIKALMSFEGVKRRMDKIAEISGVKIFDDFAHHPTAIRLSTSALKDNYPDKKILGILELGSNTMSSGFHKEDLLNSLASLDQTLILDHKNVYTQDNIFNDLDCLLSNIKDTIIDYDIILIMTNRDSQKFTKPLMSYLESK
jgi:UDP-N-acetylmuramate: L-alanyl-gamma-D-glutamyl-meso-diaminopimelate ligase